jgi:hypothetical protein
MAGRPAKGRPASPLNPKESVMQQHTSTTANARVQIGSLWIDRAHHHRLVEVIHVPDERHVRLRPVRESSHQPPSYLEDAAQLASDYLRVRP